MRLKEQRQSKNSCSSIGNGSGNVPRGESRTEKPVRPFAKEAISVAVAFPEATCIEIQQGF